MDTSLMSFVLPANYIKEGKIYRIYFECRNGNLELSVDSDAGRILWKQESIFTDTFTVEDYLAGFFSKHGGRIEHQSESTLEEDIKRMIMAYDGASNSKTWRQPEWYGDGVVDCRSHSHGGDSIADIITNSYRDMMNGVTMRTLEQMIDERRVELNWEARGEDEDRR